MTSPRAVLVSGHMVDTPNRLQPRFPQREVGAVADRIGAVFDAWNVSVETTVVCGGARGADILAAEAALARGAHVTVCLAIEPDAFERTSVELPGTDWSERYRHLLQVAEVRQLANGRPDDPEAFMKANIWMVKIVKRITRQPHVLVIWDGHAGDGPGGTADLVHQLGYAKGNPKLAVIDPTQM